MLSALHSIFHLSLSIQQVQISSDDDEPAPPQQSKSKPKETNAANNAPLATDARWPAGIAIIPGSGMNALNRRIKPIMKTAVDFVKLDSTVFNAFSDYPHRAPYLLKVCIHAAEHREDADVARRLREDEEYFQVFKSVVSPSMLLHDVLD